MNDENQSGDLPDPADEHEVPSAQELVDQAQEAADERRGDEEPAVVSETTSTETSTETVVPPTGSGDSSSES